MLDKVKIAVLAWGSLKWDPGELAIVDAFQPVGPRLPIEFSRVSSDGRLTLVIDETFGADCVTYVAQSGHEILNDAIENLRRRERMASSKGIGFVMAAPGGTSSATRQSAVTSTIKAWVKASGYDAAIWTWLKSNFRQKTGISFSVDEAIRYLETLDQLKLDVALNYVRRAPAEVRTPVRSAVNLRWPDE